MNNLYAKVKVYHGLYIWQWKVIEDLGPAGEEKQKVKGGSVLRVPIQTSPALSS
jgi:hypothetical protein